MFKVSELNPKDKVLDEIHGIQQRLSVDDKNLSTRGLAEKLRLARSAYAKKYHLKPTVISTRTVKT